MGMYDLVIIGGGPSGINIAISARRAGLNYVILEKGKLVNSLFNFPVNMTFFSTSQKLEIGDVPFISHGEKPTRREAMEYYRRLVQSYELNLHLYEPVTHVERAAEDYVVHTDKTTYPTHAVAVATGFYDTPRLLDVPGEDLPKVKHYYDDAHVYLDQDVLVIGAANSACDAALECWQKGARVTMAIRGTEIYDKVKYWIKPNIENRIAEGSIPAHFETEVTSIRPNEVDLRGPDGDFTIKNDWVLAMTGYQPNYDLLAKIGLDISRDDKCIPVHRSETLETNLPRVYLAGVVCAGKQTSKLFIENTRDHGDIIVDDLVKKLGVPA